MSYGRIGSDAASYHMMASDTMSCGGRMVGYDIVLYHRSDAVWYRIPYTLSLRTGCP